MVVLYHLVDWVAGDEYAAAGDAFGEQVFAASVCVGHEHVAGVVDNAAVDLFGHTVVVAAVACFHVKDGNGEPLGDDGEKRAVGVAEDEKAVGLDLAQDSFAPCEYLADLFAEGVGARFEETVWLAHAEFVEEQAVQVPVVVLAGVDENVIAQAVEFFVEAG